VTVAALFVRADSVYKTLQGVEAFDLVRDALTFTGGASVVAHPPCRSWSRLRAFSRHPAAEPDLARWAVRVVRRCGGVLEHPSGSKLWADQNLPLPHRVGARRDEFGGWSVAVSQKWWGHRAEKRTWLYVVGVDPVQLPAFPLVLGAAEVALGTGSEGPRREREETPPAFARWLVDLAASCRVPA